MSNRRTRSKPSDSVVGGTRATDMSYNEQSGGLKVVGPIVGQLTNKGAAPVAATELAVPNGAIMAFFNNSATVQFIQTAATAAELASAPLATTGVCLRPNDYTHVAIPDRHSFIRSSAATTIMYLVEDDSTYA